MTPVWNESPWEMAKHWAAVLGALFILLALSAVPLKIGALDDIRPVFLLMAVYYWSILRPQLLPPLLVFVLGLLLDLLSAVPPGLNALVLAAAQGLTRSQRKFLLGQSFLLIWAGFTLMAVAAGVLQWGLFSLFYFTLAPAKPMLISAVFSALIFPLMAVPLHKLHKALADMPLAD